MRTSLIFSTEQYFNTREICTATATIGMDFRANSPHNLHFADSLGREKYSSFKQHYK